MTEVKIRNTIGQNLLDGLTKIAIMLIDERIENTNFRSNPDDVKEHAVRWHQFGIITHTIFFSQCFQEEVHQYFKDWNIDLEINQKLSERIDGKTKKELLAISIPFHDLGKFTRDFKVINGQWEPSYYKHEAKSEELILQNKTIYNLLNVRYELTRNQIEYIARCAGLHFELGKVRFAVEKTNLGFTISFAKSIECQKVFSEVSSNYPEFKTEIGVLFLCDSLAKTDVRIEASTDNDIEKQTQHIKNIISERGLNHQLIAAIKQVPVNIKIAELYLKSIHNK